MTDLKHRLLLATNMLQKMRENITNDSHFSENDTQVIHGEQVKNCG